jgi:hypothetical protein
MMNIKLYKIALFIIVIFMAGCASYTENGELIRHHFGYVKVITPAIHAPEAAVTSLEVETYGIWMSTDSRSATEYTQGYGAGLGYQYDRRDFIPLDCRVVIRIKTKNEFNDFIKQINHDKNMEEGICIIRDSNN